MWRIELRTFSLLVWYHLVVPLAVAVSYFRANSSYKVQTQNLHCGVDWQQSSGPGFWGSIGTLLVLVQAQNRRWQVWHTGGGAGLSSCRPTRELSTRVGPPLPVHACLAVIGSMWKRTVRIAKGAVCTTGVQREFAHRLIARALHAHVELRSSRDARCTTARAWRMTRSPRDESVSMRGLLFGNVGNPEICFEMMSEGF